MSEVEFFVEGSVGVIRLNRPKAINALNAAMCRAISAQLEQWRYDDAVQAVAVTGAGDRGLCAGGDVKQVRQALLDGGDPTEFFTAEYHADQLLANFPKRVIAFMPGVVMGGGLGLTAHADLRIVTPTSKMAMPETKIGLFPDVGMTHVLARAGDLGLHYALTSDTFGPGEAIAADIADVTVSDIDAAFAAVIADPQVAAADLPGVVAADELPAEPAGADWLTCYRTGTAPQIVAALCQHPDPAARAAAETIAQRSPYSVVVTLQAMRKARVMTLSEVFVQDLRIASSITWHPDFSEGVRSLLIDRGDTPRWADASVAEVPRRQVLAMIG